MILNNPVRCACITCATARLVAKDKAAFRLSDASCGRNACSNPPLGSASTYCSGGSTTRGSALTLARFDPLRELLELQGQVGGASAIIVELGPAANDCPLGAVSLTLPSLATPNDEDDRTTRPIRQQARRMFAKVR